MVKHYVFSGNYPPNYNSQVYADQMNFVHLADGTASVRVMIGNLIIAALFG